MYHFSSLDDVAIDSVLNSQDPIHVDSDDSGFGSVQRNSTLSGVSLHTFCCAQQGFPTKVNNLDNIIIITQTYDVHVMRLLAHYQ